MLGQKDAIKHPIKKLGLLQDTGRNRFVNMILSLIRQGKFVAKDVLFEPSEG